jgi:hypothetical protein
MKSRNKQYIKGHIDGLTHQLIRTNQPCCLSASRPYHSPTCELVVSSRAQIEKQQPSWIDFLRGWRIGLFVMPPLLLLSPPPPNLADAILLSPSYPSVAPLPISPSIVHPLVPQRHLRCSGSRDLWEFSLVRGSGLMYHHRHARHSSPPFTKRDSFP